MKIGTQNQAFFPENILEKFRYIKEMGFDGFEIDGKLLVNNIEEVKAAIKETGLPVTTACGGYDGWIGDFIEERRLNGLKQIERILEALAEVGGSCDDGIHAAATGAIWLGAIQGFAGVSVRDGELHLNPALPEQWQQLSFPLFWQGCELQVTLDAQRIAIRTSAPVSLRLNGQLITVAEESVFCLGDFILPFNGTATKHQEDE